MRYINRLLDRPPRNSRKRRKGGGECCRTWRMRNCGRDIIRGGRKRRIWGGFGDSSGGTGIQPWVGWCSVTWGVAPSWYESALLALGLALPFRSAGRRPGQVRLRQGCFGRTSRLSVPPVEGKPDYKQNFATSRDNPLPKGFIAAEKSGQRLPPSLASYGGTGRSQPGWVSRVRGRTGQCGRRRPLIAL
jgi:hypothetical protein